MSPILKFLASARSLASQGFKKEQIYEFAQREFGEINELMQKQIENIFNPKKPIISRNKPLDPDDVLPNYNETPGEFARRETPGSKENLLQELKIAYEKEFNRLRGDETAEELKEMLKNLDTDGVPFASGGRAGYYGGGQAMVGEDMSDIGHGSDALMARNMQIAPGGQATTSTGLNYLLGQDNDTVRVPYSKGKIAKKVVNEGRRGFMKAAGAGAAGIAALKTGLLGFGEKVAPVAKEAVEVAQSVPPYFLKLVEKIKNLGADVTEVLAYKDRQKVTKYKDFELTEDVVTGEQTIQRMKVLDDDSASYYGQPLTEETYMSYKPGKGQMDETMKGKTPPDEYEEGTALLRSDREYAGEVVEESAGISDDIFEEVGEKIPEAIRKGEAEGGRIGFSKGKLAKEGIPALINKIKSLFGDDAITTADKIPTPQKTLDRNMFKAADTRLNDKRMMNIDELEDFEMEIGDSLEAYDFDGTIGDAKRILKEDKAYEAEMFAEYKSIGGSKRSGGPKDAMKEAIENASPGYTGDLKYDASLLADDLAEKRFGKEFYDLNVDEQSSLYDEAYKALAENQRGFKQMQNLSKPTKTLEGIKKTGVVNISDPDVAEEFTKFMKESDPKGYKDVEEKIILESFDPKGRKGSAEGGRIGMLAGGGILKTILKNSAEAKGMTVRDFIMAMNPNSIPSNIKNLISKVDLQELKTGYKEYYENIADMMKTRFDFQKNVEGGKTTPAKKLFESLEKTMDEQSYVPKTVTQDDISKTELMIKNKFFGKGRKANATGGLATMLGE